MGLFAMLSDPPHAPIGKQRTKWGWWWEAMKGCLCHSRADSTDCQFGWAPNGVRSEHDLRRSTSPQQPRCSRSRSSRKAAFRITVSNGSMTFNESEAQFLDNGWTHTENGTYQRAWNFTWTSPDDNMSRSEFLVYGNAVNGNDGQTGDGWNEYSVVLPGVEYQGDLDKSSSIDGLGMYDKLLLAIGLCALVGMLWSAGRS